MIKKTQQNDGLGKIDLKIFEKQEKFDESDIYWKRFVIVNILNGAKHIAKISRLLFQNFTIQKINSFYREVNINLKLNHPAIQKCYGYSLTNFKDKLKPVVIMEPVTKGSIKTNINSDQFNSTKKLINLFGIASGMAYLHSHNILHKNIDIKNIYLDRSMYPKISGFENCKEIPENEPLKEFRINGKVEYIAPEVLFNLEYSKASDVYAFGILMYQIILQRKKPYKYSANAWLSKSGKRPKFDAPIHKAYKNLIERCWSQDPKMRPTFDQIVNELKTNSEFIIKEEDDDEIKPIPALKYLKGKKPLLRIEKVDKDEYFKYIKFIEESHLSFDDSKIKINLDEMMKLRTHVFDQTKIPFYIWDLCKSDKRLQYLEELLEETCTDDKKYQIRQSFFPFLEPE
ncbi:hypothetical protein M9Y10_037635 [Tritrichomonas musculus]|uniref:Protein kinase domain-containing protein n=1 Tax=Tritrichomonas musculus TaxID=1915356 RepID=A0ABR2GRZ4_9EUKA